MDKQTITFASKVMAWLKKNFWKLAFILLAGGIAVSGFSFSFGKLVCSKTAVELKK
jgi:hypothetical protein